MIFKTITSSIDKSRTSLALFNKDWNIFKSNWQNASGGFKNKFSTLFNSNDINCLKEYNRQIQAGIKPSIAYKNCMMNCTKEAKQNAVAMAKGAKSYEQASTSIKGMTISAKAGKVALKALSTAGNILAFMAITKVISSVISVVDEMANSTKKLKESASELGENLSDTVSSIDDYKKKIEDLYNTINNSSSSIKDVTQARTDLMVVQDELIEKFGTEKNAIENITNAINGQIGALDNLSKKSYYETKNKFNEKTTGDKVKDWLTFGNTDDNRVQSNMDKMVAQMTSGLYELETTGNEVLDNLIAKSYDLNIYSDIYGDGKHFLISGELDEIQEKLYGIQELSKDFDVSTGFENNFTEISNDVDSLLQSYQDLYNQYVLYEKILNNDSNNQYDEQFNSINKAKEAFDGASKSGDEKAIQEASDNYAKALSSAIDLAMTNNDYDVVDYFEDMYPEMQQLFGEWKFNLDFEPNTDGLKDKVSNSLTALDGFSSEDILSFNPNVATEEQVFAYGELNNVAEQYGLTLQQLINLLIQMGLVQSESYQNLVTQFGQDNVNKIAPEDLTFAYEIKNVGSMTFEEFQEEIQRLKNEARNPDKITDSFINTLNSADYAEIKDELLELAKSGEITPETLSSTEEYAELLSKTETSAESATNQILDMLSAQEKLAGFSQGLDKLKSAYEEFKDEDIGFVTAETLQSLPDAFKNLPEFDLFSQIVGDPTSGAGAIQQAFNDIVKAYMLSQDVLQGLVGASEHDIQSYIANFKQMGVTNAEEVVNLAVQALNTENELINAAEAEQKVAYERHLADKNYDYERYLENTSSQNTALKNALGETYKADYDNWCELLHDKAEAYNQFIKALEESGIVYDSSKSVQENAQNAIKKEGYSPSEIDRINRAASNAELSSYLADKQKQALQLDLSQITTNFGTSYSPSTGSNGSGSGSSPSEVTQEFNWIEKYLESFARRTEKIMNRISDYLSFKKNLSTIKSAIKSVRSELSANEQALAEYAKQMNAIGLDAKYVEKIKNGALEIETITGYETDGNKDANAQLIEKIEKYQDLYDKYTDIEDTIEDLRETEKEWLVKNLEYVNEYYQKLSDIKNLAIDKKQDSIDLKEAQGKKVTTSDYKKLVSNNSAYIKSLRTTYKKTNAEFNKLVKNGTIEKNSAEWFEWKETLAGLNSEIVQAKINTAEWKDEINQIKIDNYTSSLDRLEAKYDKLNTTISRKETSNIVVTQSDYNKVIKNLDQQIAKNNKLLALYKQLQSQTQKNSEKWREYQELIEQTESTVESLRDSIIETGQKMADVIAKIRDLQLEDNENKSNLLSAKYDNATTASERNKILDEQDALAKSNLEINNQAYKDYTAQANQLGKEFSQYISNATKGVTESNSLIKDTSNDLQKERENYNSYANAYAIAQEKYSKAKTKEEKSSAKAEMQNLSVLMDESAKKVKDLESALSSYNTGLAENQSVLSQLDGYEFGKEIDLSKITDEDLLKKAAQYNEILKQQKQALIDAGLSEQEAIKVLRENASQKIQNILDEAEALDVLNQAMKNQIKSKIDLNKTQGYTISDVEYESYINAGAKGITLLNKAYNDALEQFNKNLESGVYEGNEELYLKDKANIEAIKSSIYETMTDQESMVDEVMQLRIDALTEEKEALQKLYDLQQRRYKLEEAQYNLEKAKQRTNLVYNGTEFVYQADTNALKEAEKALEEAQYGELINKIDDWIEAMEDAKEDFNLYDADGNLLGSTEDIIKAVKEFGDNFLDGFEKLLANNGYAYNNGEITKVQAFAEGGVVGKSDDDKFKAIAKSLGEDNLVAVKDGEMVLTKLQSNELYKKLVGTGTVPVPILDLKPVIPDNLVRVNTAPNVSIDMSGMQFNEVQNMDEFTREIQKMANKASSMMIQELGKRKM